MIKKSLWPAFWNRWNRFDQLVIFGRTEIDKKGFALTVTPRDQLLKTCFNGRMTITARASHLWDQSLLQPPIFEFEYLGMYPIPNYRNGGKYRFVYCEMEFPPLAQKLVIFEITDKIEISDYGPVRSEAIRHALIVKQRLMIPVTQAA